MNETTQNNLWVKLYIYIICGLKANTEINYNKKTLKSTLQ